jgi:hypothetical protein
MTKEEIHQAFIETNFIVFISKEKSTILKVNQTAEDLELLFPELESWCFITAFNPLPDILELEENQKRNKQLEHDIQNLGFEYLNGKGVSADDNWSEESFLIKDINIETTNQLAIKYGQLAFLFGKKRRAAALFYTK